VPTPANDDAFVPMPVWRFRLFGWMLRHEASVAESMGIPVDRIVFIDCPADIGEST